VRVHFAAGEHPFPTPWHNVDYRPPCDQQVDLLKPLPKNLTGIEWAYVGHFLEHITPTEGVTLLRRIRARMAPEGRLLVVGPDIEKGRRMHAANQIPDDMLYAIGAHGDPDGNNRTGCHLWDCSGEAVVAQAVKAGWAAEEFPLGQMPALYPDIPVISLAEWQFAVVGHA